MFVDDRKSLQWTKKVIINLLTQFVMNSYIITSSVIKTLRGKKENDCCVFLHHEKKKLDVNVHERFVWNAMTILCHNIFDTAIRCSDKLIRWSDKLIRYGDKLIRYSAD